MKKRGRKSVDITGKRFGKLTALSLDGNSSRYKWICLCDCGKKCLVRKSHLIGGQTVSCGCYKSYSTRKACYKGTEDFSSSYFTGLRVNANNRNLVFSICIEDIQEIFDCQSKKCYYSGLDIIGCNSFEKEKTYSYTASVDRIDSTVGYVKNNICLVHKDINKLKTDLKESVFLSWINLVNNKTSIDRTLSIPDRPGQYKGYKNLTGSYWCHLKNRAERNSIDLKIDIKQAWELYERQNGICSITGIPIHFENYTKNISCTASLDRIDSSGPYSIKNCQWVHKLINRMKWDFNQEYFLYLCKLVYDYKRLSVV